MKTRWLDLRRLHDHSDRGGSTFSPTAGTYSSTQSATISSATSGASIRYTTDGYAVVDGSDGLQWGGLGWQHNHDKTIAYQSAMTDSSVSSAMYTITTALAA